MPSWMPPVSGVVITDGKAVGFHVEQGHVVVVAVVSARDAVVENPFSVAVRTAV